MQPKLASALNCPMHERTVYLQQIVASNRAIRRSKGLLETSRATLEAAIYLRAFLVALASARSPQACGPKSNG